MKTAIALLVIVFVAAAWWLHVDYEYSMKVCQEKHSFDTCFYSLNR